MDGGLSSCGYQAKIGLQHYSLYSLIPSLSLQRRRGTRKEGTKKMTPDLRKRSPKKRINERREWWCWGERVMEERYV